MDKAIIKKKDEHGTLSIIREEVNRVFKNYIFCCCIAAYVIGLFLIKNEDSYSGAIQSIDYMTAISNESILLILIAAFPTAAGYADDWINSYWRSAVTRSGNKGYITGKIIITSIATFLVSFIGMIIFALIEGTIHGYGYDTVDDYYVYYDVVRSTPFLYIVIRSYLYAIVSMMHAVYGYAVSAILPNRFVATMAPMFSSVMLEELTRHGISQLSIHSIGCVSSNLGKSSLLNFLLSTIVVLGYTLIGAKIYSYFAGRRIRNEIV